MAFCSGTSSVPSSFSDSVPVPSSSVSRDSSSVSGLSPSVGASEISSVFPSGFPSEKSSGNAASAVLAFSGSCVSSVQEAADAGTTFPSSSNTNGSGSSAGIFSSSSSSSCFSIAISCARIASIGSSDRFFPETVCCAAAGTGTAVILRIPARKQAAIFLFIFLLLAFLLILLSPI